MIMKNVFYILLILVIFILLKVNFSSNFLFLEPKIKSYKYFVKLEKELDSKIITLEERQRLGLDINVKELEFLKYKRSFFHYDNYFFKLEDPCSEYCYYINMQGLSDDKCKGKSLNRTILPVYELEIEYKNLLKSYKNGIISNKEYKKLKSKLLEKDKFYISEMNLLMELLIRIPLQEYCD